MAKRKVSYKELYLEAKIYGIEVEMNLLNLRHRQLGSELASLLRKLKKCKRKKENE